MQQDPSDADGKIRPCLGNHAELDLKASLRAHASDVIFHTLIVESAVFWPNYNRTSEWEDSLRACNEIS